MLVLPRQAVYLNPLEAYFFEAKEMLKRKKFENADQLFSEAVLILKECDRSSIGMKVWGRLDGYLERALAGEAF
jgi:hypothetical protein